MTATSVTTRPALPGQLLAELPPIVGELSAVLDPGELLPRIAQQLRRIVDYRILVRKDARIQKELKIAQVIQHGLFPEAFPAGEAWDASAHFLPARELGGDLYGLARLRRQVEEHAGASAAHLGERILADVSEFMGGAAMGDDLTLLIVKVR